MSRVMPIVLALVLCASAGVFGQTGDSSLSGYAKDNSGGVLPGVAITATSPAIMAARTAVTDANGYYRVAALPPGTYTLAVELAGFQTYTQEAILLRASANFSVDFQLGLSGVEETVTVSGESPMLEITKTTFALNIDGEFQRDMPVQARRNWSDFLEMSTGMLQRPIDDNSGRLLYWGHGSSNYSHVAMIEGNMATNYNDASLHRITMSTDVIEDISVKLVGVEAKEPMGTGAQINIITKSGGNNFSGSVGYTYQPYGFYGDNIPEGDPALPKRTRIYQADASLGGPIKKDKVWFFGAYRRADLQGEIGFNDVQATNFRALIPGWDTYTNSTKNHQPFFKVTASLNPNHQLNGYYQYDRTNLDNNRADSYERIRLSSVGGGLFGVKLTSAWGANTTSQLNVSYNNKGGADSSTLADLPGSGPALRFHEDAFVSGGIIRGTGNVGDGGNVQSLDIRPSSMLILRADVTRYVEDWGGSHEFKTGVFLAPRLHNNNVRNYVNDGFVYEERVVTTPGFPEVQLQDQIGETQAFHRRFVNPTSIERLAMRDRDYGVYVQDNWRPTERLNISVGVRADFVRRHDSLSNVTRMDTTAIGPRVGFSFLVTEDARNVLRASFGRVHEAVNGRDGPSSFRAGVGSVSTLDVYDLNLDGVFETERRTPNVPGSLAGIEFQEGLHQPWTDEFIVGFRKQFPGEIALDIAVVRRVVNDRYAYVDVNGIYPDQPGQPFIGFGAVDPTRGILNQMVNNDWNKLEYNGLEITATKNLSNNFQFLVGIHRQWQHYNKDGTWNPTDPAGFIEPEKFPSSKQITQPRGFYDNNSYSNFASSYGPSWRKYAIRLSGLWLAPGGVQVSGNLRNQAGPWLGYEIERLDRNDPDVTRFGPPRVPVEGGTQTNPLSTTDRIIGQTRGVQIQADTIRVVSLTVGKRFRFADTQEVEIAASIFNVFNTDVFWQWNYRGGTKNYDPNYRTYLNRQEPRGLQLQFNYRF
jgi:hypothetical protein